MMHQMPDIAPANAASSLSTLHRHSCVTGVAATQKYLPFRLGTEEFAIDCKHVQEICNYIEPQHIYSVPGFIKGILKIKGKIVPIIDMRLKFGLEPFARESLMVIIIVNVGQRSLGMLVDRVSEIATLNKSQLRPPHDFATAVESDHILAIADIEGRMLPLLDIEMLVNSPALGLVAQILQ